MGMVDPKPSPEELASVVGRPARLCRARTCISALVLQGIYWEGVWGIVDGAGWHRRSCSSDTLK